MAYVYKPAIKIRLLVKMLLRDINFLKEWTCFYQSSSLLMILDSWDAKISLALGEFSMGYFYAAYE